MAKKKVVKYVLLCMAFTPLSAFAGAGWRGEGKVVELLLQYHNQGVSVRLNNSISQNGCLVADEVLFNRSSAGYAEAYSALLTAYTAGKAINIWVNGSCENNRNVGTALSIKG
ncbi:MAG: hypothetical protein ACOY5W_05250 [Pseudomonadota bacterium]